MVALPSRGFRLLAVLAALATWALVEVGGVVRVTESGLGCPHWPLCTDRALPLDTRASAIEYSHRVIVALVTVLVVWLWVWAFRCYRSRPGLFRSATAALLLVPAQALLGAAAVWLELPGWVVAIHFVVGLVFLAAVVATAACAFESAAHAVTRGFARLAGAALAVGLMLVSTGAAVVAVDADTACGEEWPACGGGVASGGGHADLQVAHRLLAYLVAALAVALLVQALRGAGPRLAGALPLAAVLAQIGFGIAIVLVGGDGRAHQILVALHVGGAGAVWAALVALGVASASRRPLEDADVAHQQSRAHSPKAPSFSDSV